MSDPKPQLSSAALEASMGYWQSVERQAMQSARHAMEKQSSIYDLRSVAGKNIARINERIRATNK